MGHLAHLGRVGRVGGVGGRLARAPELHLGVVSKNVHPHCPVFAVLVPYSSASPNGRASASPNGGAFPPQRGWERGWRAIMSSVGEKAL